MGGHKKVSCNAYMVYIELWVRQYTENIHVLQNIWDFFKSLPFFDGGSIGVWLDEEVPGIDEEQAGEVCNYT